MLCVGLARGVFIHEVLVTIDIRSEIIGFLIWKSHGYILT